MFDPLANLMTWANLFSNFLANFFAVHPSQPGGLRSLPSTPSLRSWRSPVLRSASKIGTGVQHASPRVAEIRLSLKLADYLPRRDRNDLEALNGLCLEWRVDSRSSASSGTSTSTTSRARCAVRGAPAPPRPHARRLLAPPRAHGPLLITFLT